MLDRQTFQGKALKLFVFALGGKTSTFLAVNEVKLKYLKMSLDL
jgi:hypothetical protein